MNENNNQQNNNQPNFNQLNQPQPSFNQPNMNDNSWQKSEKKANKRTIIILSILCFVLFAVGLVVGPLILKAASKNVEDGTFMYDILKSAGYLQNNTQIVEPAEELKKNKYYFSTMSNGYYYYYMIDDNGDYLYYYSKNENGDMYYFATDANGHYVGTPYQVYDSVAPTLAILADEEITLKVGEEYEEPGFMAYDDVDGNLSDKVVTTGSIDTTKVGEYLVAYTVSDNAGNKTTKVRVITVVE